MVQKYQSPSRVYKYPFELVMAAYERRFPTCKMIPVFLGSDIVNEYKSPDGAIHKIERLCRLNVDAPYLLRKIAGVEYVLFKQVNALDRRRRILDIDAKNESFSSRLTINEHCQYSVHPENSEWTCFSQDATLEIKSFFGFETTVEKIAVKQYAANIKKGKAVIEHFISEIISEGISDIPPWSPPTNPKSPKSPKRKPSLTPALSNGESVKTESVGEMGACGGVDPDVCEAGEESEDEQMDVFTDSEADLPIVSPSERGHRLDADYIVQQLGQLSLGEESALIQLRKWITDTHKGQVPRDSHILRFLKARDFNVEKAYEMLVHSIAWRKQHAIDSLLETYSNTPEVIEQHFPGGWHFSDRDGRPCFILRLGQTDVKGLIKAVGEDGIIKHIVALEEEGLALIDKATHTLGHPISSYTVIVDLEGLSMKHLWRPGIKSFRRLMSLVEAHYPETMGKLILVRAPRVFPILWTVVSPFIDENTRSKFIVYTGSNLSGLEEFLEPSHLPTFLGGSCQCSFPAGSLVPRSLYHYNTEELEREQDRASADDPSLFGNSLYQTAYVAKDFPHEILIQVQQKSSVITWDFDVMKGEVTFALFRSRVRLSSPHHEHHVSGAVKGIGSQQYITKTMNVGVDLVVCGQPCICRNGDSIQGSHVATTPGYYILQWKYFDASHAFDLLSTHKSKVVYFSELLPSDSVRGSMTSLQSGASSSNLSSVLESSTSSSALHAAAAAASSTIAHGNH